MNKKMSKRQKDIKSKLMAAICMLLVSSIMMVSSTYAWFTLSTAPEVTGIQTSVGANGNLEMALMPVDGLAKTAGQDYGVTTNVGDSTLADDEKNVTWGNLVDLSDNTFYGLDQIKLYPAALNATMDADKNPVTIAASMLKTPAYGADGRVSELLENTYTGTLMDAEGNVGTSFTPNADNNGVRAVGTASGMTPRQLAYRNARSAASTAMSQAKALASQSLNQNGSALADIALAHGLDENATHTQADVTALLAIINDLLGTTGTDAKTGVLQYIENAYKNYVIALGASAKSSMTDEEFTLFQGAINACAGIDELIAALSGVNLPSTELQAALAAMDKLSDTKAAVQDAKDGLTGLSGDTFTWGQISAPLTNLADVSAMKINGYAASTAKQNIGAIASDIAGGKGIVATIATGGGVYADIADHCGDFSAQITFKEISYGDMTFTDLPARMETETAMVTPYLVAVGDAVTTAGAPAGTGTVMPITDFFGYVVDLVFKTNADASNLLLQTDAVNRIYSQDGSEEAMGHGSTMTFTSGATDYTAEDMAGLMDAIRIVFFNPANNSVYATAKLDMTEGNYEVVGGNSITAKIFLYENTGSTTEYVVATEGATHVEVVEYEAVIQGQPGTHIEQSAGVYVPVTEGQTGTHVEKVSYREATAGESATHKALITAGGAVLKKTQSEAVITALTQNTAQAVSCLVYLDGTKVTNGDVAATVTSSMTGTMNLQFASSATLVPMDYTPLKNQGTTPAATETTAAPSQG